MRVSFVAELLHVLGAHGVLIAPSVSQCRPRTSGSYFSAAEVGGDAVRRRVGGGRSSRRRRGVRRVRRPGRRPRRPRCRARMPRVRNPRRAMDAPRRATSPCHVAFKVDGGVSQTSRCVELPGPPDRREDAQSEGTSYSHPVATGSRFDSDSEDRRLQSQNCARHTTRPAPASLLLRPARA